MYFYCFCCLQLLILSQNNMFSNVEMLLVINGSTIVFYFCNYFLLSSLHSPSSMGYDRSQHWLTSLIERCHSLQDQFIHSMMVNPFAQRKIAKWCICFQEKLLKQQSCALYKFMLSRKKDIPSAKLNVVTFQKHFFGGIDCSPSKLAWPWW